MAENEQPEQLPLFPEEKPVLSREHVVAGTRKWAKDSAGRLLKALLATFFGKLLVRAGLASADDAGTVTLPTTTVTWVKDSVIGGLTTLVSTAIGLLLVELGVVRSRSDLKLSPSKIFAPKAFWDSFSGIVIEWSQWNEWLLLGLGLVALVITWLVWRRWRKTQGKEPLLAGGRRHMLNRLDTRVRSLRTVGACAMLTAILFGAFSRQEYLWHVELPVPKGKIGVAFTQEIGTSLDRNPLADYLRQAGHEQEIVLRDLPVTFDASNIDKARKLAKRIGASAVVLYRQEADAAPRAQGRVPGLAAPVRAATPAIRHVAYIVFADPKIGVQIPVPQRSAAGAVQTVAYRPKDGVDAPRLDATDLGRLMEATAGILLYNQDRYQGAISHLQNALAAAGASDVTSGLIHFYLGNAYSMLGQDAQAATEYDSAIRLYTAQARPTLQDRLLLAKAYTDRGEDYFWDNRQLDQAEALLRKALALREALVEDPAAQVDLQIARQLHDTFGTTYLGLMDVAQYRKDTSTRDYWAGKAQSEARALGDLTDDPNTQTDAIWMQYRTGACEDAYKQAQERLRRNPQDADAHRLLYRLIMLRDGPAKAGIEARQQLQALLKLDPPSLPDLQEAELYYAVHAAFEDPAYRQDEYGIIDRILKIDPYNVAALEERIKTTDLYTAEELLPGQVLAPVGEPGTYAKLQAKWQQDPARIKRALATYDTAQTDLQPWLQEVQPGAVRPLVYAARISSKKEFWLYDYVYNNKLNTPSFTPDATLAAQYQPMWDQAVKAAERVLEPAGKPSPYEQAEAHQLLADLWLHRAEQAYAADPKTVDQPMAEALQHATAAGQLIDQHPPATGDERSVATSVYISLFSANVHARVYSGERGDTAAVAQYTAQQNAALARWQTVMAQDQSNTQTEDTFENRVNCASGQLLPQAQAASAKGDTAKALELAQQYQHAYPQDPTGMLALGWYQYLHGDLAGALATTQQFEQAAPDQPFGPSNRAVILLAQGKSSKAQDAVKTTLQKLDAEPLSLRLRHLADIGSDLLLLGRDNRGARAGLRTVIPQFEHYLAALPPEARDDQGARLIEVFNNLGGAALWAGDDATAQRLYQAGLAINGNWALLRSNLGLARLASGDGTGARQAYDQAIAAAAGYLASPDGKPLAGAAATEAKARAKSEIEVAAGALDLLLKQQPALAAQGTPLLQWLRTAAANYQ